nr:PREDICTED: regulator of G-protein signaling 20-like isoform X2 [Equus przewalskii]
MPQLSQDSPECLQTHCSKPSVWKQFLPLPRAEGYDANIHQTMENEGGTKVVHDLKNNNILDSMDLIYQRCLTFYEADSPKAFTLLPDSPGAAPKLLSLLSSTLSGLAQFFSHLLRRPPREAPQRRPDFSLLLPALPVTGLSQRHEQRSGRLSLLLGAALALPGRPPRGRLPREEDASAGQSSPMPPMGSERMEMRKRQMSAAQETPGSTVGQHGVGNRGSNACCFCWCCCCSCSCLTVRNQEEQRPMRASHELGREDLPTCEER